MVVNDSISTSLTVFVLWPTPQLRGVFEVKHHLQPSTDPTCVTETKQNKSQQQTIKTYIPTTKPQTIFFRIMLSSEMPKINSTDVGGNFFLRKSKADFVRKLAARKVIIIQWRCFQRIRKEKKIHLVKGLCDVPSSWRAAPYVLQQKDWQRALH